MKSKTITKILIGACTMLSVGNTIAIAASNLVPVMSITESDGFRVCHLPTTITVNTNGSIIKEYCDLGKDKMVTKKITLGVLSKESVSELQTYADSIAKSGKTADDKIQSPCADAPTEKVKVYSFKSPSSPGMMTTQELKEYLISVSSCGQTLSTVEAYEADRSVSLLSGLKYAFHGVVKKQKPSSNPNDKKQPPVTVLPIPQ